VIAPAPLSTLLSQRRQKARSIQVVLTGEKSYPSQTGPIVGFFKFVNQSINAVCRRESSVTIGLGQTVGAACKKLLLSCGCALGVLHYRSLRDGGALAISEVGLTTGLGARIEGRGIVPDTLVALTLDDFQRGRDAALEAAVEQLARAGRP